MASVWGCLKDKLGHFSKFEKSVMVPPFSTEEKLKLRKSLPKHNISIKCEVKYCILHVKSVWGCLKVK